jgi:hypothetical protein
MIDGEKDDNDKVKMESEDVEIVKLQWLGGRKDKRDEEKGKCEAEKEDENGPSSKRSMTESKSISVVPSAIQR